MMKSFDVNYNDFWDDNYDQAWSDEEDITFNCYEDSQTCYINSGNNSFFPSNGNKNTVLFTNYDQLMELKKKIDQKLQESINAFECVLNSQINFNKNKKVPKDVLNKLYDTFRENEKYKNWQALSTTTLKQRKKVLLQLFEKKNDILKELNERPQIFLHPVHEFVAIKMKNYKYH